MKKKMTKLFIGVTVLIAIVMSFGCGNDKPPITPTKSDDEKIVETIKNEMKNYPDLEKQEIDYSSTNNEIILKGTVIGSKNFDKLFDIGKNVKLATEIKSVALRYSPCEELGLCSCPNGCQPCQSACLPPEVKLRKMSEELAKIQAFNNIEVKLKDNVLEASGKIPRENLSEFINLLTKINSQAILNLEVSLKSGNLPNE